MKYKLTTQNINKKSLLNEISTFVEDIINDYNVIWSNESQRDTILEVVDLFMEDLVDNNKIVQWDVICDDRNNSYSKKKSTVFLDITYKQKNCYNVSKLSYAIDRSN